jgi:hypothetical protein
MTTLTWILLGVAIAEGALFYAYGFRNAKAAAAKEYTDMVGAAEREIADLKRRIGGK